MRQTDAADRKPSAAGRVAPHERPPESGVAVEGVEIIVGA